MAENIRLKLPAIDFVLFKDTARITETAQAVAKRDGFPIGFAEVSHAVRLRSIRANVRVSQRQRGPSNSEVVGHWGKRVRSAFLLSAALRIIMRSSATSCGNRLRTAPCISAARPSWRSMTLQLPSELTFKSYRWLDIGHFQSP